jgi:hypothetical protein
MLTAYTRTEADEADEADEAAAGSGIETDPVAVKQNEPASSTYNATVDASSLYETNRAASAYSTAAHGA